MPLKSYKMQFFSWSLLLGSALLLSPSQASQRQPAAAGTDVVTSAADNGASGTLRSVLAAAAAGDTITFDPTVFAVPQTISLSGSELDITRNVTIQGPGANRLTIDAQGTSYVFNISGGTVALSGMTVAHGAGANRYGGIVNAGTLTLTNVVVSGSTGSGIGNTGSLSAANCTFSANNNVGGNYSGGGLYNSGATTLTDCTFANNAAYNGGAVLSGGNSTNTLTLTDCTFANNKAQFGGAIYMIGRMTATSCTFSGNSATQSGNYGGGLFNVGTGTITSSLFVGSTNGDIDNGSSLTSGGSNLLGDAAGNGDFSTAGAHDQFGVTTAQAGVGPLASNGGLTQTCALLSGSPAIDADYNSGSSVDQRGVPRPQGVRNDIGAYEAGPIAYTLWNSADGQVQVRAVTYTGSQTTVGTFGPYTDAGDAGVPGNTALWKAIAVVHMPDGTLRLLWQHPDGRVMLWRLSASGAMLTVTGYGPYTDAGSAGVAGNMGLWKTIGLSATAEGQTHLLWDHPDGRAMLWNVNADDSFTVIGGYGPYTDSSNTGVPGNTAVWHATALANAYDGSFRLLWNHPDGRVMLWNVNGAGTLASLAGYGPYTDSGSAGVANNTALWKAVAVQMSTDNQAHLLWDHPDGRSMLWTVDGSYNMVSVVGYGPYTDAPISSSLWQALGLALTPANLPYVLWSNPDNRSVLWNVGADGTINYSGVFEVTTDSAGQPWQPNAVSGL